MKQMMDVIENKNNYQMSKDKLISVIIKKETYKDIKPYLIDIKNNKEETIAISIQAAKEILTTQYNSEAKLYAVRFLKDAMEKGNTAFIQKVETLMLPILVQIALDQLDQKSLPKYAGSSFTKNQDLTKFKSIVSSLFRMARECIIKWAEWIPDQKRKFLSAFQEIQKKGLPTSFQFKYFRPENYDIFLQNCQKPGFKMEAPSKEKQIDRKNKQKQKEKVNPNKVKDAEKQNTDKDKEKQNDIKIASTSAKKTQSKKIQPKKTDPLINKIEEILFKTSNLALESNEKEIIKLQNDFNEAINNYLEGAQEFNENYMQNCFNQFEKHKENYNTKKMNQKESKLIKDSSINSRKQMQNSAKKQSQETMKEMIIQKPIEEKQNKNIKKPRNEELTTSNPTIKQQLGTQNNKQFNHLHKHPDQIQTQKSLKLQSKNQIKSIPVDKNVKEKSIKINQSKDLIEKTEKALSESLNPNILNFDDGIKSSQKQITSVALKKQQYVKNERTQSINVIDKQQKTQVPAKKQVKIHDPHHSISKDEERVHFSEEDDYDQSEESEDGIQRINNAAHHKKYKLTAIVEEPVHTQYQSNKKPPQLISVSNHKTEPRFEASFIKKEADAVFDPNEQKIINMESKVNKNYMNNKLLQENKIIIEKYQILLKQFQVEQEEKLEILKEKKIIEKQLKNLKEEEAKLIKKIKSSVPMEDYSKLRKQFEEETKLKQRLIKDNSKLHEEVQSLKQLLENQRTKCNQQIKNNNKKGELQNKSYKLAQRQIVLKESNQKHVKIHEISSIQTQVIDEDYVKNLTHPSHINSWMNESNKILFKKCLLGLSSYFYRDDYVNILREISVYTKKQQHFINIRLIFQFKNMKQITPETKYKNCTQIELWTKPLNGSLLTFEQELVCKIRKNPLRLMKAHLKIVDSLQITYLMPFMYLNFLREEDFKLEQFDQIFKLKTQQLQKSRIFQINNSILKEVKDFKMIFKNSILDQTKIKFCLSEGISDNVFMGQIQNLKLNKAILRILPIPFSEEMIEKVKQLMENVIFLIS